MKLTGRSTPLVKVKSFDFLSYLCRLLDSSEEARTTLIGFTDKADEEDKEAMKTNKGLIVACLWYNSSYGVEDIIEALKPIKAADQVVAFLEGWLSGRNDE
jgi:hypothetical protein